MRPYYQDEFATIYCGDCREVLPQLAGQGIDLVLTDPPYSSGARTDSNRQVRGSMLRGTEDDDWFSHDAMTTWGFQWFMGSVLSGIKPILQAGAHLYWFTDWRMTPTVYGMLEARGFRVNHCLVWAKTHFGMGTYWRNQHENIVFASAGQPAMMRNRGMGSVITSTGVSPSSRVHPTEKPLDLLTKILAAAPVSLALDPFMGSGATLLAAKQLGIRSVGIEMNEAYCEIGAKRLQDPPMIEEIRRAEQMALLD